MGLNGMEIYSDSEPFTMEHFTKLKSTLKLMVFTLAAVGLLSVVLTGLVIWLGVATVTNQNDISKLGGGGLSMVLVSRKISSGDSKAGALSATTVVGEGLSMVSPVFQGTGYWSIRTTLPSKRSDHQVATIGTLIYIVGGNNEDGEPMDSIVVYDTVLGQFSDGPTMPTPLARFALVYVPDGSAGSLYLIGGLSTSDGDASAKVHILNIATGAWTSGPDLNTPRSDFCGALVGQTIYVAGGWPTGFIASLASVEMLNIGEAEWQESKEMPTPRGDCKCSELSGEFVVVGGYHDETDQWQSDSFRDEVEAYDPKNESWRSLSPLPNARGDKAVVALPSNRMLVIGGETHYEGDRTEVATHHVEEYLGDHDIWVTKAPLPLARFRMDAAFVDGIVYVFGGHAVCKPGKEESPRICPETDEVQAFFDVDHPDLFFVEEE